MPLSGMPRKRLFACAHWRNNLLRSAARSAAHSKTSHCVAWASKRDAGPHALKCGYYRQLRERTQAGALEAKASTEGGRTERARESEGKGAEGDAGASACAEGRQSASSAAPRAPAARAIKREGQSAHPTARSVAGAPARPPRNRL